MGIIIQIFDSLNIFSLTNNDVMIKKLDFRRNIYAKNLKN